MAGQVDTGVEHRRPELLRRQFRRQPAGEEGGHGGPHTGDGSQRVGRQRRVDRLPDQAVDGAAILLREVTDGRIDPEQAWFWTREWQDREREADKDLAAGKVTRFESDEDFLAALDERTKPLDADA